MNDLLPIHNSIEPMLIAGPCSAENLGQMLATASGLHAAGVEIFRAGVWKPRTRPGGFEGCGERALQWLREVKDRFGMLTATEVGCARHAELALQAGVDVLWIGARTSASPFAMDEIAEALAGTDVPVLVKNPICADLDLWIGAVERLYLRGLRRLGAIHRGFKSAADPVYRNTPHWEIADALREVLPGLPVICDPSHMAGRRDLVGPLVQEAMRRKYDGLIIEAHATPDEAWTDAAQQLTPAELGKIMAEKRNCQKRCSTFSTNAGMP